MHLPIRISCDGKIVETKALIDSGAGGTFMDQNFAQKHQLPLEKLYTFLWPTDFSLTSVNFSDVQ